MYAIDIDMYTFNKYYMSIIVKSIYESVTASFAL